MRRAIGIALVVLASLLVATGCDKATGGGWIPSIVPGEKATFGFSARCKNRTVNGTSFALLYDGQFEYEDHAAPPDGVRIHGDVEPFEVEGATCEELDEPDTLPVAFLHGTYRAQPDDGTSPDGEFLVVVTDGGEPGTINGDHLHVELIGLFTYTNDGEVQGGNIQVQ